MTKSLKIYGFRLSGHSHRVELFAELANIPNEFVQVDLAAGEQKQAAFLKLNPFGQVPVLEDGETVIVDANAILVYLAKKYAPDWLPEDAETAAEIQRFLSIAAGEIRYGPAVARLITVFGAPLDADQAHNTASWALTRIEAHLEGKEWLVAGKPTIADVALYSYTAHAPEGNVDLSPYPNVLAWLKRVEDLPRFIEMPATKAGLVA
ncbi:MAG: glutathione S-transferase [Sneathiella sp.]